MALGTRKRTTDTPSTPDAALFEDGPTALDITTPGSLWYVASDPTTVDHYQRFAADRDLRDQAADNARASDMAGQWIADAWRRILTPTEYGDEETLLAYGRSSRLSAWPTQLTDRADQRAWVRHLFIADRVRHVIDQAAADAQFDLMTQTARTCACCGHVDPVHGATTVRGRSDLPWAPDAVMSSVQLCDTCWPVAQLQYAQSLATPDRVAAVTRYLSSVTS